MRQLKTAVRALRRRLRGRADSEHEQAILRIVIVASVLVYMLLHFLREGASDDAEPTFLIIALAADLAFAFGVFVAICIWPEVNVPRRVAAMLADAGTATLACSRTACTSEPNVAPTGSPAIGEGTSSGGGR